MFSSSKLAFWCFENALNSWLLLKMNFWCKKLWFYVSEFCLIWWPYIHFLFVLMGPLKSEWPFPVFWTRWNGNASLSDWFHMHTFISSLPVPKFETQIHKTQDCILNAVRISLAYSMRHTENISLQLNIFSQHLNKFLIFLHHF